MNFWLWVVIGILIAIIVALLIKIHLLQKAAMEIKQAFADRLMVDTNTLIDISSRDRYMCQLASAINAQLRQLRRERHRFRQGDMEVKASITNISHDLRTPLTAICGYLELLELEEKSETVNGYIEVIRNRAEAMKQLTEELFRYSIVTSTLEDVAFEMVTLNSALEQSICTHYAALKGCQITPNISIPEKPIKRNLSKNALSRIFENVIGNAIKYSDGDLDIMLSEGGEMVFSNHASGLNKIQVGKLFDRFYTVETAKKSTGLGLSIAKVLTEQMNGTITASYEDAVISVRVFFPEAEQ